MSVWGVHADPPTDLRGPALPISNCLSLHFFIDPGDGPLHAQRVKYQRLEERL